jgi:small subunit ribosomal protein S16
MAVKIRLARHGATKKPYYRIVVTDSESKRDGRFLENVGTYDPKENPAKVTFKTDRLQYWLGKGATPTDTVRSLLKKGGVVREKGPTAGN